MKIGSFVVTRDSALWLWGAIVGWATFAVGVLSDPALNVMDLSSIVSPRHMHQIQVLAVFIVYVSGKMSTSALPGAADADKVKLPVKDQK